MLEMFLGALEDELGLIVSPPLAPVARMKIVMDEITRLTRAAELQRAPVQSELNWAVFCRPQFHLFIDGVCAHCGYDERPVQNRSDGG